MATAVIRYTVAAVTDRGRRRGSNQDAFGYSVEHGVYLVCDGMGGAAAGEVASSIAVEEVLRHVAEHHTADRNLHPEPLPEIAEEAVHAANSAIHARGQRNLRLTGMGTTLVGLLTGESESRVWILNVGDSRCYRLRKGRLMQCTQDHSVVEEQVRLGRMTRAEAARSPLRSYLTRALGTQNSVTPDVFEAEVEPGDLFLLCSDGLTGELSDDRIEALLSDTPQGEPHSRSISLGLQSNPASLEELCRRLVHAANKAGGNDNITCLILRVE